MALPLAARMAVALLLCSPVSLAEGLEVRPAADLFTSIQWVEPALGKANPENRALKIAALDFSNELRPKLRFELSTLQVLVRPRFKFDVTDARLGSAWQREAYTLLADVPELYASWTASSKIAFAYGLQNYQWGPAEAHNPSNPLFHVPGYSKNLLTLIKGKHLLRVNYSPLAGLTLVGLFEVFDNGDPAFVAGQSFERKGLLKLEYAANGGFPYIGIVGGKGEASNAWFGEYGALEVVSGLSIYADARHTKGSSAWYPTVSPTLGPAFAHSLASSARVYTLGVAGARYTFDSGPDLRIEGIYNDAGYTASDFANAPLALGRALATSPAAAAGALSAYAYSGLELPGRGYLYASARFPDLGAGKRVSIDAHYLQSFTDTSGAGFVNVEWIGGDSWELFASASATPGRADSDLARGVRSSVLFGSKYAW